VKRIDLEVRMDQTQSLGGQDPGQAAGQAKEAVKGAAADVAETVKEQFRDVAGEVGAQGRSVAAQVRDGVAEQARVQQSNLAEAVRRVADELEAMAAQRPESPAATVVSRVAAGGHDVAQFLAERGPEGVLAEVQDFARRRPGAFLATALVSGFVVGRLGRGVLGAATASSDGGEERRRAMPSFADDSSTLAAMGSQWGGRTDVFRPEEDTLVYSSVTEGVPAPGEPR
jgi:hypothetical protein